MSMPPRVCRNVDCGKSYTPHNPFQRYCCKECFERVRALKKREYNKRYYRTESRRANLREYYSRDDVKAHRREVGAAWVAANKEKVLESRAKYKASAKGVLADLRYKSGLAYKASRHRKDVRRRFRKHNNGELAYDRDIHLSELVRRSGSAACSLCGVTCDHTSSDWRVHPTVDHIKPLISGGTHTWDNVRLLCLGCNSAKSADDLRGYASALAQQLLTQTPESMRRSELIKIKHSNPTLHALVLQRMDEMRNQAALQGREMVLQQMGQGG